MLSVVIAAYNDPEGLYLSLWSIYLQLKKTGLEWEIVIAADGGTPTKWESIDPRIHCLRIRTGSPQGTRDAGIRAAKFSNVMCIESHVIVSDPEAWLKAHVELGAALSFPCRVGESFEQSTAYGATFDWNVTFWNGHLLYKPFSISPYRILQCGHSAFLIDREFFYRSGGYTNLQQGYGGEEPWLNLKIWMLGRESWMIPSVSHAHYMSDRGNGAALTTTTFALNFKIAAYVYGGDKYMNEIFPNVRLIKTPAIEAERQRIVAGSFHGDLDKLREYLKSNRIVS